MDNITEKAWEVFRSVFKDGEDVVVEDSDGKFYWGKLFCNNDGIILTRPRGKSVELFWEDIEFMSHDGFPVSRIMKMSKVEAYLRAKQTPNKIIRSAFDKKIKVVKKSVYYGGCCPFMMGPIFPSRIFNHGNSGRRFWHSDANEVLEFKSQDGAILHSYDTDHLFVLS